MRGGRAGMSLIEVVTALTLSSLLLVVVLSSLLAGRSLFLSALDEAGLTRVSYLVPRDLLDRLTETSARSIYGGDNWGGFASAHDVQGVFRTGPDGRPAWQAQEVYYVVPASLRLALHRFSYDPAHTGVLPELMRRLPIPDRIFAEGVRSLRLEPDGEKAWALTLGYEVRGNLSVRKGEIRLCAVPVH